MLQYFVSLFLWVFVILWFWNNGVWQRTMCTPWKFVWNNWESHHLTFLTKTVLPGSLGCKHFPKHTALMIRALITWYTGELHYFVYIWPISMILGIYYWNEGQSLILVFLVVRANLEYFNENNNLDKLLDVTFVCSHNALVKQFNE